MDRLKREHEFITELWQLMKSTDSMMLTDESVAETMELVSDISSRYKDLPFVPEMLASWIAELDRRYIDAQNN